MRPCPGFTRRRCAAALPHVGMEAKATWVPAVPTSSRAVCLPTPAVAAVRCHMRRGCLQAGHGPGAALPGAGPAAAGRASPLSGREVGGPRAVPPAGESTGARADLGLSQSHLQTAFIAAWKTHEGSKSQVLPQRTAVCSPRRDVCRRSGGEGRLHLEPGGAGMGFAVAAAHLGRGHGPRWRCEMTSSARRVSRRRGLGAWSPAVVKFSIKEKSSNITFFSFFLPLTLDLSKCLVPILAFSIFEGGPKSYHSVLPRRI